MNPSSATRGVDRALQHVGERIRSVRTRRRVTLSEVGRATGLSPSMVSMVERGIVNPSVGTLVAITDVLGIPMVRLFDGVAAAGSTPVVRRDDQPVVVTSEGVQRRILIRDQSLEVELAENTYEPGTSSAESPIKHRGRELGIVLSGELQVQVGGETYHLHTGDAIHFDSTRPHRFVNRSKKVTRTIWVNLHGRRTQ